MGGNGGTAETALSSFSFSSFSRRIQMFAQASKTLSASRVSRSLSSSIHGRKRRFLRTHGLGVPRKKEGRKENFQMKFSDITVGMFLK